MRTYALTGLLGLLAGSATATAAEPAASGTFSFRDGEYVAVDAVAWRTGGDYPTTQVAISDKPFDPDAMLADGVIDDADMMAHTGATLTITYMPEDQVVLGIRLRNETGHGADFRCEGSGLLTVEASDEDVVSGRFACQEHQVSFTAPVVPVAGE